MTKRKKIPITTETQILVQSGRRCCLCFGINNDFREKRGQIAHLDKNPSNANLDNLAFLCLEHHDLYDTRRSQSKGLTIQEVKQYRDLLYKAVLELRANTNIMEASTTRESLYLLPRIKTGKELVEAATNSHFYTFHHDEPITEQEVEVLGEFLQSVVDFCEDLGSAGPKIRIETASYFTSRITELEETGYKIFGKQATEKKQVNGIYDVWVTSYISVIRNSSPTIIDLQEVRNMINQDTFANE